MSKLPSDMTTSRCPLYVNASVLLGSARCSCYVKAAQQYHNKDIVYVNPPVWAGSAGCLHDVTDAQQYDNKYIPSLCECPMGRPHVQIQQCQLANASFCFQLLPSHYINDTLEDDPRTAVNFYKGNSSARFCTKFTLCQNCPAI